MIDTNRLIHSTDFPPEATVSTRLILMAAEELGVSWHQRGNSSVFELQLNDHYEQFCWQVPTQTTFFNYYICQHKQAAKTFLSEHGVSTSKGVAFNELSKPEDWVSVFDELATPYVVKPLMGEQGEGVTMDVSTAEELIPAMYKAIAYSNSLVQGAVVEELFVGKEYRIVTTKDKVLAVTHRIPANVIGDGQSTIQQLIAEKNKDPLRGDESSYYPLYQIQIDSEVKRVLNDQKLTLGDIPESGTQVFLRYNSNLSTGGDCVDVTDQVHPSVHEIALKTINSIPGLVWAGLDLMTTDITQAQTPDSYVIVELNISPGISMQEIPVVGQPRQVAKEFIYLLFPELLTSYDTPTI